MMPTGNSSIDLVFSFLGYSLNYIRKPFPHSFPPPKSQVAHISSGASLSMLDRLSEGLQGKEVTCSSE